MGSLFAGSVCLGMALGYAVDAHFGVSPWGILMGGLLGMVGGFYHLFKGLNNGA